MAGSDNRTLRFGAIYLWGYAVEMTIKAAFFRTLGFDDEKRLQINPQSVRGQAATYGLTWQGRSLHDLKEWTRLLIAVRASPLIATRMTTSAASELRRRSSSVAGLWAEWMRYHAVVASSAELLRMQLQAKWFVDRFDSL